MKIIYYLCLLTIIYGCQKSTAVDMEQEEDNESFSFIFMTDIHYAPEKGIPEAFRMAIDTANQLNADFVLTGGDLVYDVLRGNYNKADSLFLGFKKAAEGFDMPFYPCIGNHELFAIKEESPEDSTHQDYKYGMFERHFGDTYYSFDHKGWHFMVLNSIEVRDRKYVGGIDDEQMEWIKNDLSKIDKNTPIAIAMHIPMMTAYAQAYPQKAKQEVPNDQWIHNRTEVLNLFDDYNLRLALQGHMHWIEDLNIQNRTRFITGGSLAGRPSWRRMDDRNDGLYYNEEGFMHFQIDGEQIDWEYINIGWESIAQRQKETSQR